MDIPVHVVTAFICLKLLTHIVRLVIPGNKSSWHSENYTHSSAGFYCKGVQGIFSVATIMGLIDM